MNVFGRRSIHTILERANYCRTFVRPPPPVQKGQVLSTQYNPIPASSRVTFAMRFTLS